MQVIKSATDSGDQVTYLFDSVETAMHGLLDPFDEIKKFMTTMNGLSKMATGLDRAISTMAFLIIQIGSRCPLWPVKAIVSILKNPLKILKNAMKK